MNVYFDNAASTAIDTEVFDAMKPFILGAYGNPSSTHAYGRKMRAAVEVSRKEIATILGCKPGEIVFTSGGTEANNSIITGAITTYSIQSVISSTIEHPSVKRVLEKLEKQKNINLHWVRLDEKGHLDYTHLENLLQNNSNSMVSLMHANNEVGNLTDIKRVARLCNQYGAYFHSDTVQSVGHYVHDLKVLNVHAITASAHKFHGPKGVGFMYIDSNKDIEPYIYGGSQERNRRAGTENTPGIVGLAKAMEIAYRDIEAHTKHVNGMKKYMIDKLKECIPSVTFNGNSGDVENSLYTVLNVSIPEQQNDKMMLFNLDLEGICASGGSACSSGSTTASGVINILNPNSQREAIRFSFSKYTKYEEVDYVVEKISMLSQQMGILK